MVTKKEIEVFIREGFWEDIKKSREKHVHVIMIWTKPDIIKQAPLYLELIKRGKLVILIHTGQHYDFKLSEWVIEEFWMKVDINLNIFWDLHVKYSLIIKRLWDIFVKLKDEYNKIPVPYVHWDTLTATTADKAAFLNQVAVVHVEAWIRTFTPNKDFYHKLFKDYEKWKFDWKKYYKELQNHNIYELGSIEPFPEQFDTRSIEASTGLFAAPVKLYQKTLIDEWFPKENIKVVWNTIADAVKISLKKKWTEVIYEQMPILKGKPYILVTIHRRENTESRERYLAIYNAIKKLIQEWVYTCLIKFNASEAAIDRFWLRQDIENLEKNYPENFVYAETIAEHSQFMRLMKDAWAVVTDSGWLQEEANIVWSPCVTIRFGSDRSETFLAWTNIIAPPINSNLIADIIKWAIDNKSMKKRGHLYWKNISKKIVDEVVKKLDKHWKLFLFDDERLELTKYYNWDI